MRPCLSTPPANIQNLPACSNKVGSTAHTESIKALSNSQRARNERQSRMNEAQLKLEQARMKEQYLVDQIRERYMFYSYGDCMFITGRQAVSSVS